MFLRQARRLFRDLPDEEIALTRIVTFGDGPLLSGTTKRDLEEHAIVVLELADLCACLSEQRLQHFDVLRKIGC